MQTEKYMGKLRMVYTLHYTTDSAAVAVQRRTAHASGEI